MDWAKMIMGESAVQTPFNFVRQKADDTHGLILGQEHGVALAFGSNATHVLVMGDMIFRPHLVIESEHLVGMGAAGIITSSSFADIHEWVAKGRKIFDIKKAQI